MYDPITDTVQDLPEQSWLFVAKAIGAVAGSAVSIAYVLPNGRREAAIRFLTGAVAGLVFGSAVGHKMAEIMELSEVLSRFEIALTGATLASLSAWWGLGILARLADRHGRKH